MNGIAVAAGAFLVLLVALGFQEWRIGNLHEEAALAEKAIKDYKAADKKNQEAVADCKAAAKKNVANAERKRTEAEKAADRSEEKTAALERKLEGTNAAFKTLSESITEECGAADNPAFIEFLCNGPLGCNDA